MKVVTVLTAMAHQATIVRLLLHHKRARRSEMSSWTKCATFRRERLQQRA
jgi:hypothetical protein